MDLDYYAKLIEVKCICCDTPIFREKDGNWLCQKCADILVPGIDAQITEV